MKKAATFAFAVFLMGCTSAPRPIVVTPVETVEVKVEVPTACVKSLPEFPPVPEVPRFDVSQQMLARIEREAIYLAFANQLYAMLKACSDAGADK